MAVLQQWTSFYTSIELYFSVWYLCTITPNDQSLEETRKSVKDRSVIKVLKPGGSGGGRVCTGLVLCVVLLHVVCFDFCPFLSFMLA